MSDKLLHGSTLAETAATLLPTLGNSDYEVVSATPASDAKQVWESIKQPWSATPHGRLAIRSVSRGVLGAAFYAWGTQKAVSDMAGYDADNPENALQFIASVVDKAVGRPMIRGMNKLGLNGDDFVSFRPSLSSGSRTLGEDAIFNTFDFAMASTGDALGRNIIGLFDPNSPKKWRGEDGRIIFPEALKSLAATAGRVFDAQAEDWFVAIPYTFQQKFQRKLINHFSPGFEFAADTTLHGGTFKLDEDGKVIGTYAAEGMIDLQARFTGYNIGTAVYRDVSKLVKNKVRGLFDGEEKPTLKPLSLNPETMFTAGREGLRGAVRYALNRIIKTTIIMTPSVPVFSIMRVPQNKHRGLGVMPDGMEIDMRSESFEPYGQTYGRLDKILNPLGEVTHKLAVGAGELGSRTASRLGADEEQQQYAGKLANVYVNATMAYTPYIYAKAEFAHHWDNPDMDAGIYRTIDGVFNGNLHDIRSGLKEVGRAIKYRNAETVEKDKQHREEPLRFTDRVGKREKSAARESAANWQQQVGSRETRENEFSNSR